MTKPVLVASDLDKEFRVEADVSNYATGGVLTIKCSDKKWRPVKDGVRRDGSRR